MPPTPSLTRPPEPPQAAMRAPRPARAGTKHPPSLADLWATISAGHWFRSLVPELAQQLQALAQPVTLAAGDWLFRRGDPPCGLYAVARGTLDLSGSESLGGPEPAGLLSLAEPPMWLGEISLFDGHSRTHDVRAATDCCLLHVPQAALREWLRTHPAHWQPLALLLADRLRACQAALEEQVLLPAPQRLARRLVRMAEGFDPWLPGARPHPACLRRELGVSQEHLARMLGLSRQTTNQILQALQQSGCLLLRRGKIEIRDGQALRAAGGGTPVH